MIVLNNSLTSPPSSSLPPLEEDKIQVQWLKEGEEVPFDGLLMNDYTYKRIRLNLLEEGW